MDYSALLSQIAPTTVQQAQSQNLAQQQAQGQINMQPLQQAALNTQIQSAQQDLTQKRRAMALSMLNGVATEPDPEKQQALYDTLKPMAERYDPTLQLPDQYDPTIGRALTMSQIPVASMPEYQMNMAKMRFYNSLSPQPNQQPNAASNGAMPNADGTSPMAAPPSNVSALLTNPGAAVFDPQAVNAAAAAQKALQDTPEAKQAAALAEAKGKDAAAASKGAVESGEGYKQVEQTIDSIESLIKQGNVPQAKYGVTAQHQAWLSQNFPQLDGQKTANAYNTFSTVNEAQTINAIRYLAVTGQIRMTRTLENIINRGYLVDPDASDAAKMTQAEAIKTELKNSAVAAQNISAKMSGGPQLPYQSPVSQAPASAVQQAHGVLKQPQAVAPQPGSIVKSKLGVPFVYLGGDPKNPASYKPYSGGAGAGN